MGDGSLPGAVANRPAVAALALGVLSLPGALTLVLGLLLGLAAVILGFVGVNRARALEGAGEGLAVGGIITGMFGMALGAALGLLLA